MYTSAMNITRDTMDTSTSMILHKQGAFDMDSNAIYRYYTLAIIRSVISLLVMNLIYISHSDTSSNSSENTVMIMGHSS